MPNKELDSMERATFGLKLCSRWARMPSHVRWNSIKSWMSKVVVLATMDVLLERTPSRKLVVTTTTRAHMTYLLMYAFSLSENLDHEAGTFIALIFPLLS